MSPAPKAAKHGDAQIPQSAGWEPLILGRADLVLFNTPPLVVMLS